MLDTTPIVKLIDHDDGLLVRLFLRHFRDAGAAAAAVDRLRKSLAALPMKFQPLSRIREVLIPPCHGKPVPSLIYYFVPGTGWSTEQAEPRVEDPQFMYRADGISLNLGCPLRLARAMDTLGRLDPSDRTEAIEGIINPSKHFTTIEELLWLRGWKAQANVRRGGRLEGAKGNVDWAFNAGEFQLLLEAKTRFADWPILADGDTYRPKGTRLANTAPKFPTTRIQSCLHLVGITSPINIPEWAVHEFGLELSKHPQIDAVVYRSLVGTTHSISLYPEIAGCVAGLLAPTSATDWPSNYIVSYSREARDVRLMNRESSNSSQPQSTVTCVPVPMEISSPVTIPPFGYYRCVVSARGTDGEPRFAVISPG